MCVFQTCSVALVCFALFEKALIREEATLELGGSSANP
jgi:hypothetical protein